MRKHRGDLAALDVAVAEGAAPITPGLGGTYRPGGTLDLDQYWRRRPVLVCAVSTLLDILDVAIGPENLRVADVDRVTAGIARGNLDVGLRKIQTGFVRNPRNIHAPPKRDAANRKGGEPKKGRLVAGLPAVVPAPGFLFITFAGAGPAVKAIVIPQFHARGVVEKHLEEPAGRLAGGTDQQYGINQYGEVPVTVTVRCKTIQGRYDDIGITVLLRSVKGAVIGIILCSYVGYIVSDVNPASVRAPTATGIPPTPVFTERVPNFITMAFFLRITPRLIGLVSTPRPNWVTVFRELEPL